MATDEPIRSRRQRRRIGPGSETQPLGMWGRWGHAHHEAPGSCSSSSFSSPSSSSCPGSHPEACQDLGDAVLLLLGLIIAINIGLNLVTLIWRRLRGSLRRVFHYFCPKCPGLPAPAGPPALRPHFPGVPDHRLSPPAPDVRVRCTMDPVKLTLTPPAPRCRHGPSAPDPWAPDMDDEKASWPRRPSSCRHGWDGPVPPYPGTAPGIWNHRGSLPAPAPVGVRFPPGLGGTTSRRASAGGAEPGAEAYGYSVGVPPGGPEPTGRRSNPDPGSPPSSRRSSVPPNPSWMPLSHSPRPSLSHVVYDARELRRRVREGSVEVSPPVPPAAPPPAAPGTLEEPNQDWRYQPMAGPAWEPFGSSGYKREGKDD
ncbi:LOW QUALITY PROTEIN: spermatid maturation protein 1-like [Tachyglossus aculeatus]|uniref:LOW QUALITY PROTEIN: spermatid maturation protein 1-like n=1 Tax=Tachyglossus aculeatus TaxID=9261 RepID=UPI0018F48D76|nr:LOW QUALITY PROTEIN: spermatid maturation protein 1-like [Tachyglossus aculeatus]